MYVYVSMYHHIHVYVLCNSRHMIQLAMHMYVCSYVFTYSVLHCPTTDMGVDMHWFDGSRDWLQRSEYSHQLRLPDLSCCLHSPNWPYWEGWQDRKGCHILYRRWRYNSEEVLAYIYMYCMYNFVRGMWNDAKAMHNVARTMCDVARAMCDVARALCYLQECYACVMLQEPFAILRAMCSV